MMFRASWLATLLLTCGLTMAMPKQKLPWYLNDVPQAAVPRLPAPPTIDGLEADGEWAAALAFTGFMNPPSARRQPYLLPELMQPRVQLGYDDEWVYLAFESPLPADMHELLRILRESGDRNRAETR